MHYLYLICLIVSIGMILWLKVFDVRRSIIQFINLLIVVISNLGFYFVTISAGYEETILAHKIALAGGVFLPVFYFFLVLEICHISLNRFASIAMVMGQGFIYSLVCTMDKSDLFYKNIATHTVDGICIITEECGTWHFLFPLMMFLYFLASIIVANYSLLKKKAVNKCSLLIMLIFVAFALGVYVAERIIDPEYELIPIVYVVLMLGSLIPVYDSDLYTVEENKYLMDGLLSKVGFMTFDRNFIYKGCNECMENIFPELKNYLIGHKFSYCSQELEHVLSKISLLQMEYNRCDKKEIAEISIDVFSIGDRYYVGKIFAVTNAFGKLEGYTVVLRDDTDHQRVLILTERYNEELSREVEEKTRKIKDIQAKVIVGMAQMVESRDLSTGGHIKRTSDVVKIFADKLKNSEAGFEDSFLENVINSAPMHDLGKLGIDDAILRKKSGLTDEDFEAMKKHPEIGFNMVRKVLADVEEPEFIKVAENVAHYHHEKMDGTGYPVGLKGEEIPVEARIMALADVYDALVSKRCYKAALSSDEAFDIIKKGIGTHFDPDLTKIFFSCKAELEDYYKEK
ncbi:MAG: HD domain-containing protein [Lachnospiraceae bacterium]|nr:HD domain-containing protein [Lachnospiraceae bacterium]